MNCPFPRTVCPNGLPVVVPCGKCPICLENKRNEWSFRLSQELRYSSGALFVTLTYHPKFYPEKGVTKRHVQLFIKRLRKKVPGIRYYLVGEYGSQTGRAHYHVILFNVQDADKLIRSAWQLRSEPIGLVDIRPVTEGRIRYITKYVIQRYDADPKLHRPFALMSRAYGLGGMYLSDEMVAWHRDGMKNYAMWFQQRIRLPRFYKEKIWWRVVKPNLYEILVHRDRQAVSDQAKAKMLEASEGQERLLREMGYDPATILAEMRNAAASRIKQKVAYSQTI